MGFSCNKDKIFSIQLLTESSVIKKALHLLTESSAGE